MGAGAGERTTGTRPWWWDGVVYQVYIRSFADGNGDGTGDLAGLRSRLPYLRDLGVDALWINPWYRSPLRDGGYDVADYRDIDPRYGTVDEAEAFITEAHALGLRVLADLVPNHTSSEHAWFEEALAAPPGDPARDRYWFRPGLGPDGSEPPNDWTANFGGPAWERAPDGEWYLHLFDPTQPDLDWDHADVREEFDAVLRFWLDRGIDGFRVDVAHGLVKDRALPDVGVPAPTPPDHPHWDRDALHEIVRRWRAVLDEYEGDRMLVAEAWVASDRLPLYLRPDEYHQAFNFDLLGCDWDASAFRSTVTAALAAAVTAGSISTWVLSNHDVMRHATRYGLPAGTFWYTWPLDGPTDALDPALGLRRARAAALLTLALPGAAYLYQGEELGLPEVWDLPTDVLDDPVWDKSGHTLKGRDGCRVPIPWSADGPSLGFGDAEPWLPQPTSFADLAASVQEDDPASTLHLYRRALSLRRQHLTGADERVDWLELGADVVALRRSSGVTVAVNMGDDAVAVPAGEVLVASGPVEGEMLPGDTGVWVLER